jgi:hypothetical protein
VAIEHIPLRLIYTNHSIEGIHTYKQT